MLCQKCHKNLATVRYAEVVDGRVRDLHLCQDCLACQQNMASAGFELAGASGTARRHGAVASDAPRSALRRSCRGCGLSLESLMNTGQAGCALCYEVFGDAVSSIIEGIHGASRHQGKAPELTDARLRVGEELQAKRTLLRTTLSTENYEEAAILRDEIRALEAALQEPVDASDEGGQ